MDEQYLGDRVMRMWMRSVWNRLGARRGATAQEPAEGSGGGNLTVYREGRPEPLVLLAQTLTPRSLQFRTPDRVMPGERLHLRVRLPGVQVQLDARVKECHQGTWTAALECAPEQLLEVSRWLAQLGQAAA